MSCVPDDSSMTPASRPGDPDGAATGSALDVTGLRKSYGGREAVRGLSLRAPAGAITAVLGPNGAGKTTTLECCVGLRRPDSGTITVLGTDRADHRAAARLRHRVGVMVQEGGLPMAPVARSVLTHVARLHDRPAAASPLLGRLGLDDVARTRVRHLSGGQRQRLALACAIVGDPELVFLDEPTAGLDPQSRLAVWDLLRELRREGTSMVLSTHLMTEAEELADHVEIVDRGQVVAAGSPAALRGSPRVRVTVPGGTEPQRLAADLGRELSGSARLEVTVEGGHVLVLARPRAGARADRPASARPPYPDGPLPRPEVDAGDLAVVAGALAAAGYGRAEAALTRPSLEDTFLALTGRELRTSGS